MTGTKYVADPHFGHVRGPALCGRPYPDVTAMDTDLVTRWNDAVDPDDVVFVLGDVALGQLDESLRVVSRLHGVKILIPGNHDRCHPLHGEAKALAQRDRYLRAGFADVTPPTMNKIIGDRWVTLSHFPFTGDSHDGDRYTGWRPVDDGGFVVHGHVHGKWLQRGRQINVGVDAWAGYPVPESVIASLILAGSRDITPLPWQAD